MEAIVKFDTKSKNKSKNEKQIENNIIYLQYW